jgi:hypothetical protein
MVRDCDGENNPYSYGTVKRKIIRRLREYRGMFEVVRVPNITNICYGRDVGYKIEEIKLSKQIEDISATKIRESENERPVDNKN